MADGGKVAYVPVYIPPSPSSTSGDSQLSSSVLTPTVARHEQKQQQPRKARKQSYGSSTVSLVAFLSNESNASFQGCEGELKSRGKQQNKATTGGNKVPSLKDVVAEVYNEQPGCVITLRKIQKLGYKASHIIKQHFATK